MNFAQTVRNKRKAMGLTQQLADILEWAVLLALALNLALTIEGYENHQKENVKV